MPRRTVNVCIRPALPEDWPAVQRISSRIWEGNDYVPLFFRQWVRRPGVFVAEVRGRVVGWDRGSELSPGNWWLEGLRVDPEVQGKGVGMALFRHMRAWVLDQRPLSLRLSTADVNKASVYMNKQMGFKLHSEYRFLFGKPPKPAAGPEPAKPRIDEALRFLQESAELQASRGLLAHTWLFRDADRKHVGELVRSGAVHAVRRGRRVDGLLIVRPHRYDPENLDISFLGGGPQAQRRLAGYIGRRATEQGSHWVYGMAASTDMEQAFARLRMKRHEHIGRVLVFEYQV